MIKGYHRPKSLQEALQLLEDANNIPIGGGTTVSSFQREISVVDLQNLDLNRIIEVGSQITIGSTATLESMMDYFYDSPDWVNAIKIEASKNQREAATIGGLVCSSGGRSPLLSLLLTLNPTMKWQPGDIEISLGEFLAQRKSWKKAVLLTELLFEKDIDFRFESIGRSPFDLPIICIAIAKWPSKRLRITAGGFGLLPTLILDGNMNDNVELAVENALLSASDEWSSAEYRIASAKKIAARLMNEIDETGR